MVNRWDAGGDDANLVHEEFAAGHFNPSKYKARDIRKVRVAFEKYKPDNFRKNVKKIAKEFLRNDRVPENRDECKYHHMLFLLNVMFLLT